MQAVKDAKPAATAKQYLTFFTAGEEYAFDLLKVKEIIEYTTVTAVPNTPPWICGVTNLRGSVVPVVDLAVKFGLPASTITKFSCIVVTEVQSGGDELTMGVLADSVSQVMDFADDDIEDPPAFGTRVKVEYLLGMGPMGKKFCLILDIDKVLSTDELLAVTEIVEHGEQDGAVQALRKER
ncbi:MAG TPA: chemotaxis protein CheW [Candidatus Angelobacter sp.]|nr:chemotaxis protein CheW [Candidatus Angelobacter sp.]